MAFSTYLSLYAQGMADFLPVDEQGEGHMVTATTEPEFCNPNRIDSRRPRHYS